MDEADRCDEIAFMTQGRIILRDTPSGMKQRVPGRVIEVSVSDYRGAMPILRALPCVSSLDVSGEMLRVLVSKDTDTCESTLSDALTSAGFTVYHVAPAQTDLEMAFATLIPPTVNAPRGKTPAVSE
jgi:ABC-2 type transport system ATP-binding protein